MGKAKHLLLLSLWMIVVGSNGQVRIHEVRLTKYTREQPSLNLGDDDLSYTLECVYDAPVDSIVKIVWTLDGYDHNVYTWDADTNSVNVDEPLITHVETDTDNTKIGPNIHFKTPSTLMKGYYTCFIFHNIAEETVNPVRDTFNLQMYYFDSTPFKINSSVDGCDIVLQYSSNFMYPKPNATCGFWSESQDRSIGTISGGLIFRQDSERNWQVTAPHTRIQVKDIPRNALLYCDINLPVANITQHNVLELSEESIDVYEIINERGCASNLTGSPFMEIGYRDCELNCRDECQKINRFQPSVEFSCENGHYAYWPRNMTSDHGWLHEASCNPMDYLWYSGKYKTFNHSELPVCLNGSERIFNNIVVAVLSSVILTRIIS